MRRPSERERSPTERRGQVTSKRPPATPRLSFALATPADAGDVVAVRVAAARDLTERFGRGHWSSEASERGVLSEMRISQVWLARRGRVAVATFRLGTRKPWAIDASYFTAVPRAIYLTDMAVLPAWQHRGVGRRCLDKITRLVRRWPADAVRLDAYDAPAGAGPFYARSGYREVGRVAYRGNPLIYFELVLNPPRET